MEKPKPCPFCGCKATVDTERRHSGTSENFYFVGCSTSECIASIHSMNRYFLTIEDAIEAWNRRIDNGNGNV